MSKDPVLRLEHVGIAASDVPMLEAILESVLGRSVYKREEVASESVVTHFLEAGSTKIEILESLDASSALGRHLEKRGPGLHHLAFEVADIQEAHERLSESGFEPLSAPKEGADGKAIFFLHPKRTGGLLVELCATRTDTPAAAPGTGPVDAPTVWIDGPSPDADLLSQALARRFRIADDDSAQIVVLLRAASADVRRAAALPASRLVLVDPDPQVAPPGALVIDTGIAERSAPADVRVPRGLWSGLPDPWSLLADLIRGHVDRPNRYDAAR